MKEYRAFGPKEIVMEFKAMNIASKYHAIFWSGIYIVMCLDSVALGPLTWLVEET